MKSSRIMKIFEQLKNRGNFGTTPLQIGLIAYVEKWLSSGQCDFMKKKDK
jgi:hypothetical protein